MLKSAAFELTGLVIIILTVRGYHFFPGKIGRISYLLWNPVHRKSSGRNSAVNSMSRSTNKKRTLEECWGLKEEDSHCTVVSKSPPVFCDLDGVLADFSAGVINVMGKAPEEMKPQNMWPRLARANKFYATLPWMEDGKILWEFIKPYHPTVLTGLPRGKWAESQKREWCARELGPASEVPVITCMSRDKPQYCKVRGSILIDDRISAKEIWEKVGGVFVHHTNTHNSIEQLKKLLKSLETKEMSEKVSVGDESNVEEHCRSGKKFEQDTP